jgi:MFS family permease
MLNTLPIMAGVLLYGKVTGKKFSEMIVFAMVSTTIAPIVSEVAFLGESFSIIRFIAAYGIGIFIGFIFPVIANYVQGMHNYYCLYNGGIAGGFIATMFAGLMRGVGIEIIPENLWDTDHTIPLAIIAYSIAFALILYGIITEKGLNAFKKLNQLLKEHDPYDNDYLVKYHNTCYINIGIMCIISTSVMLLLGKPINGPVLGGIFTVSGFAACGKHLRNATPIIIGSIIAVYLNHLEFNASVNTLAILFSTGMAPIAGKYGWHWGIITGFLHVSVAVFIGDVNGGLNLYNNGFAGSFISVLILPIIVVFKTFYSKMKSKVLKQ